jgi:hypothetical protein
MQLKNCRVTIRDDWDITISSNVTASSVYEAAAAGVMAIQKSGMAKFPFEPELITVTVNEIPVEHQVKYDDLMRWANRPGGRSPREITERLRVRGILGIPDDPR